KPTARGPPGETQGPTWDGCSCTVGFPPNLASQGMPVWLGEVNPAIWRKVSRHVIRTDSDVRTSVEVLFMFARFTEGTIDPKKREQAETIAESIFTAARKQKGFKGVSFCLDPKGEAVFVSLWDSKEAMQANEASGYY